jgi:hypothetical protein
MKGWFRTLAIVTPLLHLLNALVLADRADVGVAAFEDDQLKFNAGGFLGDFYRYGTTSDKVWYTSVVIAFYLSIVLLLAALSGFGTRVRPVRPVAGPTGGTPATMVEAVPASAPVPPTPASDSGGSRGDLPPPPPPSV